MISQSSESMILGRAMSFRAALHAHVAELAVCDLASCGAVVREADLVTLLISLTKFTKLGDLGGIESRETFPCAFPFSGLVAGGTFVALPRTFTELPSAATALALQWAGVLIVVELLLIEFLVQMTDLIFGVLDFGLLRQPAASALAHLLVLDDGPLTTSMPLDFLGGVLEGEIRRVISRSVMRGEGIIRALRACEDKGSIESRLKPSHRVVANELDGLDERVEHRFLEGHFLDDFLEANLVRIHPSNELRAILPNPAFPPCVDLHAFTNCILSDEV